MDSVLIMVDMVLVIGYGFFLLLNSSQYLINRYVPTSGKLTVGILECRRLKKMDITGASGKDD